MNDDGGGTKTHMAALGAALLLVQGAAFRTLGSDQTLVVRQGKRRKLVTKRTVKCLLGGTYLPLTFPARTHRSGIYD